LGADLGAEVVLLEEEPGGQPFDEANAGLWWKLRQRLGAGAPAFPDACFSATVELRGQGDIEDNMGRADAGGLFRFLQRRGVIAGDPGPAKALCRPTPLEATDVLPAPHAGLVVYRKALGDRVAKGETVAELIDLMADVPAKARTAIVSRADGLLFSRLLFKLVRPGDTVAKVAGAEKLAHRMTGNLLEP